MADGLRKLADGCHNTGVPDSEILDVLEIRCTDIPNCSDAYDVEMLADLIDPGICQNIYRGACVNGFECSVCGCVVEDCGGYYVKGEWNFCPKCRKKVVDD